MDYMIWVVVLALFAYLVYAVFTAPPSSGCLSKDLARARDEQKATGRTRRNEPATKAAQPAALSVDRAAAAAEAPVVGEALPTELLRNPESGETAPIPNTYRFAKRWIKEALVSEGLLDKVYSAGELDDATAEKIKSALLQFRTLEKYRA